MHTVLKISKNCLQNNLIGFKIRETQTGDNCFLGVVGDGRQQLCSMCICTSVTFDSSNA